MTSHYAPNDIGISYLEKLGLMNVSFSLSRNHNLSLYFCFRLKSRSGRELFKSSRFVEPEAFGSRRTEKTWLSAWWLQFGSFSDFPSPEWFMARNAEVLDHIHLPALLHLVSFYGMWPYYWAIFRFFYESMSRQVAKLTRAIRVVIQFNMSGYTVCFSKYHDTSLYILTLEERKYIMQDVFDYKNKIRF